MRFYIRAIFSAICVIAGITLGSSISAQPPAPPSPPREGPSKIEALNSPKAPKGEGATLSVRALDASTGVGIPGVDVRVGRAARAVIRDLRSWTYTARTDAQGDAVFTEILADEYTISLGQKDRILVPGGESSVMLAGGSKPAPRIFRMFQTSLVEGLVEDRERNPLPLATVELLEERWTGGQRSLARINAGTTDAKGRYSISSVLPGTYYLCARPARSTIESQLRVSDALPDAESRHMAYFDTLYPSAPFLETALPLVVYPGANQQSVRIEVQRGKYYAVRGQLGNLPKGILNAGAFLFIRTAAFNSPVPLIADEPEATLPSVSIERDGKFSYDAGLPPGRYRVEHTVPGARLGGTDLLIVDQEVEIETDMVEPFAFQGKIIFEDGTPNVNLRFTLRTFSQGVIRVADVISAGKNGRFSLPLYVSGTSRIELPDNPIAIQKIEKDGRTYEGAAFEMTRSSGPATITLSRKGATISGTVALHETVKALPRGMVTLSLEPANPLDNPKRKRLDGTNTFAFEHLPAGRYRLCAWTEEGTEINRVLGNPYYDQRLAALCRSVEVRIDDTKSIELKQLSALEIQ